MTTRSTGPLAWSAVAILLAIGVVLLNLPSVARAALRPRATAKEDLLATASALLDDYDAAESTYLARFEGRSAFFEPPQTSLPPHDEEKLPEPEPEPEQTPDAEPTPRPDYEAIGGRPLLRLHGDLAVFDDGTRLRVGEERNGLELLEVRAPWTARVKLRDWEYDVELFAQPRDEAFFDHEEVIEPPLVQVALAPTEAPAMATPERPVHDDPPVEEPSPETGGRGFGSAPYVTPGGGELVNPGDRHAGRRIPELLDAAQMSRMTHQELIGYTAELVSDRRWWEHNARTPDDQVLLDRIDQTWQTATARLPQLHLEARGAPDPLSD